MEEGDKTNIPVSSSCHLPLLDWIPGRESPLPVSVNSPFLQSGALFSNMFAQLAYFQICVFRELFPGHAPQCSRTSPHLSRLVLCFVAFIVHIASTQYPICFSLSSPLEFQLPQCTALACCCICCIESSV